MPALPWWFLAVFVVGANFAIWGAVGVIRLAESRKGRMARRAVFALGVDFAIWGMTCAIRLNKSRAVRLARRCREQLARAVAWLVARSPHPGTKNAGPVVQRISVSVSDVAVLMPAHNEAAVLGESLAAIMKLVPAANIHVVSDGSTDDTPGIARRTGVHVHETERNVGKAGALLEAIEHFTLIDRYPVVLLLDADTRVQPDYFTAALPLFDAPDVVAVAGCVRTARDRRLSLIGNILVGHRERIYTIGQRLLKFGQTYLRTNATHIVPGFASMYRTDVLPYIDLNPPGLVIEDFNMTFEVYQKSLGKVAFTLAAVAVTQDPDRLHDYVKQTRRWAVGLWQTVRRHPPRANLFTAMLALLLLELVTSSVIFVLLPLIVVVLVLPDLAGNIVLTWPPFADLHALVAAHMTLTAILFGVLLPDYALTCLVAVLDRRARLLFFGLFFPVLRVIDAAIALSAVPAGWFVRSNGIWQSPTRRALEPTPVRASIATETLQRSLAVIDLESATTAPGHREAPASPDYLRERGHASG
jgi:poly-beta-1,6-N-acetyl-D-glucosamine synthase